MHSRNVAELCQTRHRNRRPIWNVDMAIDDVMDDDNLHVMTITGDTSDSDDLGCEALE